MNCDVLVVGASSSGLMAAISAAREGSSVVLMDRDLEHLDHAANTLFEGMAARSSISIESCYLVRVLDGMSIISPGGASVTIPAKGYFIDRQRFDERYLEAAEDEGVLLMRGEVKRTYADGGRRTVEYGEGEIDARVVVDASGVGSRIAAQAGLQPIRHPDDIAWALEATVEHPGLGEERLFQYWIGSIAPGWKATFSPAGGDRATLGVFVRGHGPDVQPFFSRFLQVFKAVKASSYRDIGAMRILSFRRGGDPIAVLPGEIVADSLMVTGGAAGQSGLAYSLRAGAICGSVAARAVQSGDCLLYTSDA
ncbi:MAG: NAD(P)/FAD-dependent oxidoreductase, partial [Methanothrix sp.]|nr:NAD(P)/FAD-dependent oxidoreductase [Methanothrix sp.]